MSTSNATEWKLTIDEFREALGIPDDADVYHALIDRVRNMVTVSAHTRGGTSDHG